MPPLTSAERFQLAVLHGFESSGRFRDSSPTPSTRHSRKLDASPLAPAAEAEMRERAIKLIDACGLSPHQKLQCRMLTLSGLTVEGYLLPPDQLALIAMSVIRGGRARALFHVVQMEQGKKTHAAGISAQPTASWEDSDRMLHYQSATFTDLALEAKRVGCAPSITSELTEDIQPEFFVELLAEIAGASTSRAEDLAGFTGDGSSTYGGFTGLLGSAGAAVPMKAGRTSIAQVTADDALTLKRALPKTKRSIDDSFMMGEDVLDLILGSRSISGELAIVPAREGGRPMLWNRPVEIVPALDELTDAPATRFMAYGNPRAMLMGIHRDFNLRISAKAVISDAAGHVTLNAFGADLLAAIIQERIAFKCADPTRLVALATAAS